MLQVLQKQMCQVERSEMVDPQCHFEILLCPVCWRDEDSRIVDQYVQRQVTLLEVFGKLANRAASR